MTITTAELPVPTWEGAAIRNVCSVPGTVACLARTLHEQRLVLVTTQHALYGGGALRHSPVSLPLGAESLMFGAGDTRARPVACVGWGKRGTVRYADADVFVDCAVVELDEPRVLPRGWQVAGDPIDALRLPVVGSKVRKTGAATGTTAGTIVEIDHTAWVRAGAQTQPAPWQIVISSLDRSRPFSRPGDSGALVRDEQGAPVGLLWGVSGSCSVACPIAPVWWVLHVQPMRLLAVSRQLLQTRNP